MPNYIGREGGIFSSCKTKWRECGLPGVENVAASLETLWMLPLGVLIKKGLGLSQQWPRAPRKQNHSRASLFTAKTARATTLQHLAR